MAMRSNTLTGFVPASDAGARERDALAHLSDIEPFEPLDIPEPAAPKPRPRARAAAIPVEGTDRAARS